MIHRISVLCISAALLLVLGGCAKNQMTRQNYDLIRVGSSTRLEVKSAMGEKHMKDRGGDWEYEDMDKKLSVWFYFDDKGIVSRKQWMSGEGLEDDSNPDPEGQVISDHSSSTTIDKN